MIIKGGRVIDPASHFDQIADVKICGDRIIGIGRFDEDDVIIDATQLVVAPGLIDGHVHFRDPGFTYKEDIVTGSRAAAAGGFTSVVTMANTQPAVDCVDVLNDLKKRQEGLPVRIYNGANVTKGLKGEQIVDMAALKEAGAVVFTDDGIPLTDEKLVYEAFGQAKALDMPISLHEEDPHFIGVAGYHEGEVTKALGFHGAEALAEEMMVARDGLLALKTGARVDIQHVSSAMSLELIHFYKEQGADIWCEVTPQHFSRTDELVLSKGSLAKVNPPLRTEKHRQALIKGLQEGVIDMIVTDHAPHHQDEKEKGLTKAPSGMIGLETSLALAITSLVKPGYMSLSDVLMKMTYMPAQFYRIPHGQLTAGSLADVVIFDAHEEWQVTCDDFHGKSHNSPFIGDTLTGRVKYTIMGGRIVYQHEQSL